MINRNTLRDLQRFGKDKGRGQNGDSWKNLDENEQKQIRSWLHPVVQIMKRHGFGWGIYNTQHDFMHFGYNTTEGKLNVGNESFDILIGY